ncbi:MAG: acyltransferase family protein, partial [Clostridiales bacterium]|nr:acyltransferase family protein [Clostridiales bacterium]
MIKRESKFELLRIIAIIMVLAIHTVAGMIQVAFPEKLTWKYCAIIYSISHTAVPIFIMLTGFFSYKSTTRVILKTKRLVVPYIAYFVLFLAYTMIFPPKGILLRDVFISQVFSFGTTNSSFYFGQMYYLYILLAVIILSPYINTLIENINKKSHRNLIIALVVLLFAIPTINAIFDVEVLFVFASSELKLLLPIFITYYIIGAYFSKYDVVIKKRVSLLIFLVGSILVYALSYFWSVYHPLAEFMIRLGIMEPYVLAKLNEGGGFSKQFMNYDSLLILFSSCGLLLFFKALKV